jgi:hypothetical protein
MAEKQYSISGKGWERIVRFSQAQMTKLANYAKSLIYQDQLQGKLQGTPQVQNYKSQSYKRYKANGMRRTSFDTEKNPTGKGILQKLDRGEAVRGTQYKLKGGKYQNTNARLKGFEGGSLNTDVGSVNMILTGKTSKGLRLTKVQENFATLSYPASSTGLIEGNEKHGYIITTLSDENMDKAEDMALEMVGQNIAAYFKGNIVKDLNL